MTEWILFKIKNVKNYHTKQEDIKRSLIFANKQQIDEFKLKQKVSHEIELNQFADVSDLEWNLRNGNFRLFEDHKYKLINSAEANRYLEQILNSNDSIIVPDELD